MIETFHGPLDADFWTEVDEAIEQGLVRMSAHPTLPLDVYCYSRKVMWEQAWTRATSVCRGLVVERESRKVISRPMSKFHNYAQVAGILPDGPVLVQEKVDGSMLVVSRYQGDLVVNTKGSFTTVHSEVGRKLLDRLDTSPITGDVTFVFEVIFPAGRIVVDYGDTVELVLLTATNTDTGRDLPAGQVDALAQQIGCRRPERLEADRYEALADLFSLEQPNAEGFVAQFVDSGVRVKVKFAEYLEEHARRTSVPTARRIWDALRRGTAVAQLIEDCPDEFDGWVRDCASRITAHRDKVVDLAVAEFDRLGLGGDTSDRGAIAAKINQVNSPDVDLVETKALRGLLFAQLSGADLHDDVRADDGQPVGHCKTLWNAAKPAADEQPDPFGDVGDTFAAAA